MSTFITHTFDIDDTLRSASKGYGLHGTVNVRVDGDYILVWAPYLPKNRGYLIYGQSKRVIRLPRMVGTVHAYLELCYENEGEDDEYLWGYDLDAIIRPVHEEEFMRKHRLKHVEVVRDIESIRWTQDVSLADAYKLVFSDGERFDEEVTEIGENIRYVNFNLRNASWVIHEDQGWNRVTRTLYTTSKRWWNLNIVPK